MAPAKTCPTCKRPMPKPKDEAQADAPARGKKWTRLIVVMPEQDDKEALEEKLDIIASRYEEAAGRKIPRYVLLDWALHEIIDRNIVPSEEGA